MDTQNTAEIIRVYEAVIRSCQAAQLVVGDDCNFSDLQDMINKAKNHIMIEGWYQAYGIMVPHHRTIYQRSYVKHGEYCAFVNFDDEKKRISWSDDGKQPEGGWYFNISFPTGAYIFGYGDVFNQEYPVEFFNRFFTELKSYLPNYVDTANKSLYWRIDRAKDIYNDFDDIYQKYVELNKADYKLRKIQALRDEAAKLEAT